MSYGLIFDMDGVIWRNQTPIGNPGESFSHLYQKGIKIAFATNNLYVSEAPASALRQLPFARNIRAMWNWG